MKTFDSKDASFSSYLIPQKPNTCQPHHQTLEDSTSELSIFDAHKYFNEVTNNNIQKVTISDNNSINNNNNSRVSVVVNVKTETEHIVIPESTTRYSSASSLDSYSNIRNYRTRSFHAATPTASSEASWNSQQGLLSHPPGAISVSMKNPSNLNPNPNNNDLSNKIKTSLSKPIWLFRRKCPCSGKKSVQVNEKKSTQLPKTKNIPSSQPSNSTNTLNMESNFNSQKNWVNVDQTETNTAVKSQRFPSQSHNSVVTTVRVPVPFTEGFTFPVLNSNATSSTKLGVQNGAVLEDTRRDSLEVFRPPDEVVSVEAKSVNFAFLPAMSRVVTDDGDAASDASSDLFEIESFSTGTQSTYPPGVCRRSSRDSFDETPAMTECYEPSEASIEWSVTTADGYDEGSCGGGSVAAEQWKRKGGNGLLVSCRCEKAVSVGPHPLPVKCGGGGATSAWRHVSGVGSGNKPPIARSYSHSHHRNTPRVTSIAFAT